MHTTKTTPAAAPATTPAATPAPYPFYQTEIEKIQRSVDCDPGEWTEKWRAARVHAIDWRRVGYRADEHASWNARHHGGAATVSVAEVLAAMGALPDKGWGSYWDGARAACREAIIRTLIRSARRRRYRAALAIVRAGAPIAP